jgi:cellulose synthase/poly-beta-1,6-N-acetylglucosamine synthase-like glycosyltransferase
MELSTLPRTVARAAVEPPSTTPVTCRPKVHGKFLTVDGEKFWVRGVTYGTFGDDGPSPGYPSREMVAADFRNMAAAGFNSVRVYTIPPVWLLDEAAANGLRVMVGLPWEQHVTFLDKAEDARAIVARMEAAVRSCANHPAILCYAVGNEIPASVVRWYGRKRVTRFLKDLTAAVRRQDPTALVTYVNFPTTEYLDLPFVDFVSFNVYLEDRPTLARYLARLQNLAGERPLIMAEVGLDSRRNGEAQQADTLAWQVATCFEAGVAGTFIYAWTDEWHRGGHEIEDWDFGLTTRDRRPKPALAAVSRALQDVPFPKDRTWPRISVVVCSFNGAQTIEETLIGLAALDYANYEVIVVNDGSTDSTPEIASRFDVRLISTENRGLSAARNTGMEAATGEIVAYIDDDAYPDPHWLQFLAAALLRGDHAAMGGPNLAPYTDNLIAECVANSPGGPLHVLLSDEVAEHIPGCNMAYWKHRLQEVGGFDPIFRVAGDDVHVCWKLQEAGHSLGFCAAAMVWHHRRGSIRRYLTQQRGYAKAEALLAEIWPEKYNSAGHMSWHGRIYGRGLIQALAPSQRVYHGPFGSAPFQSLYQPATGMLTSLPLMPEWYFLVLLMTGLALLGLAWSPLLWLWPVALTAIALTLVQAIRGGLAAAFPGRTLNSSVERRLRLTVAWLHLLQPAARLQGRIQHGIGPWRLPRTPFKAGVAPRSRAYWSEAWRSVEDRLSDVVSSLKGVAPVAIGGDFDRWDFTVRGGLFGSVRVHAMVEEHGAGRQLFRLRTWPIAPPLALAITLACAVLASAAAWDRAWFAAGVLAVASMVILYLILGSVALAQQLLNSAVTRRAEAQDAEFIMRDEPR